MSSDLAVKLVLGIIFGVIILFGVWLNGMIQRIRACGSLFLYSMNRKDNAERAKIVSQLEDQKKLASVVLDRKGLFSDELRRDALERLTDQSALASVARAFTGTIRGASHGLDLAVVRKLTDQSALAAVAKDGGQGMAIAAVQNMTDPSSLLSVMQSKSIDDIRESAAQRLLELARENPQAIKAHWSEIRKAFADTHSDMPGRHQDFQTRQSQGGRPAPRHSPNTGGGFITGINSSSDCHDDRHSDTSVHTDTRSKHHDVRPFSRDLKKFPAFIRDEDDA